MHALANMQKRGETLSPETKEPLVRLRGVSKEFPGVLAVDGVESPERTGPASPP